MWGQHLILDLGGCSKTAITDEQTLRAFTAELIDAIDMTAYGETLLVRFGELEAIAGYSLVQLIETSAVTGHFVDATGEVYLDIFSCKAFDEHVALAVVERRLQPQTISMTSLRRQAPPMARTAPAGKAVHVSQSPSNEFDCVAGTTELPVLRALTGALQAQLVR
jgi:S-adenosylmethionine/arginine decarboxylase-like enzyme